MQYQIQEMLRAERIFETAEIRAELDGLQPADPGRHELEGDDADRVRGRGRAPGRPCPVCAGIEEMVWVRGG